MPSFVGPAKIDLLWGLLWAESFASPLGEIYTRLLRFHYVLARSGQLVYRDLQLESSNEELFWGGRNNASFFRGTVQGPE